MSPYNIPGETPSITNKMESCVQDVMSKGIKKFKGRTNKESAIAICKSSMMKGMAVKKAWSKKG